MATSIGPDTPASTPPPGQTSNFIEPPSQAPPIIILEGIFIPLMLLTVATRVYVRSRITKVWGFEDSKLIILKNRHAQVY
jgi:hypothetical protein